MVAGKSGKLGGSRCVPLRSVKTVHQRSSSSAQPRIDSRVASWLLPRTGDRTWPLEEFSLEHQSFPSRGLLRRLTGLAWALGGTGPGKFLAMRYARRPATLLFLPHSPHFGANNAWLRGRARRWQKAKQGADYEGFGACEWRGQ